MFLSFRFATLVYALTVFTVGYVAAATIHDLWAQADRMQTLVSANAYGALDPAAGSVQ